MPAALRLLILGTGSMAAAHARAFRQIAGVELVAGVDFRLDVAAAFCAEHGIPHAFASLEDALRWGQFDAACNVTPDGAHYATTLSLLAAGKHVLCEKPLSTDHAHALEMVTAAEAAGCVNMVNLTYRNVPALQEAARLVASGAIGQPRHFEASYLQSWLTQPAWGDWRTEDRWLWRLSTQHGSKGVLGDVGIHILDYVTFIAGAGPDRLSCRLETFSKAPLDRIGPYPLDANDSFAMHLSLEGGALGTISATRFASGHHNDLRLRLYGDAGGLEVRFEKKVSRLTACLGPAALEAAEWTEVDCPTTPTNYHRFVQAIRDGEPGQPDFRRGAELQHMLDLAERSHELESRTLPVAPVDLTQPAFAPAMVN